MGILKRKDERTQTVTVRVPAPIKAELDRLREETGTAGFDLNATLADAVMRVTRQIRDELKQVRQRPATGERTSGTNGLAGDGTPNRKAQV
jgi:peptide subunit release factor 1 (eRF1)